MPANSLKTGSRYNTTTPGFLLLLATTFYFAFTKLFPCLLSIYSYCLPAASTKADFTFCAVSLGVLYIIWA